MGCEGEVLSLLRKEVIQPQIPLGLPCYDLALLTNSTLGVVLPLARVRQTT